MSITVYKDVFISYRRDTGSALASIIKSKIESKSAYSCFLDIDNLGSGHFKHALLPYIEQATAMIVTITEGYIERCLNPDDICLQEITHAVERGKQLILATSMQRKDIRNIVNDNPKLPDVIKGLIDYNIFYIRPGDVIEETIDKIILSIGESRVKDISDISLLLNRSYIREKNTKPIRIGMYEFEYSGSRIGNYLYGYGKLVCIDAVDMTVEGKFDCDVGAIAGEVKITYNGSIVFNGILSSIDSIIPLRITGTGTYSPNTNVVYEGYLEKGMYNGYGTHMLHNIGHRYTGYFKDNKKHGPGELRVNSKNYNCLIKACFVAGLPKGEMLVEDYKYNIIMVATVQNRRIIGKAMFYITKHFQRYAELTELITPRNRSSYITYGVIYNETCTRAEDIYVYQNKKEIAKAMKLVSKPVVTQYFLSDSNIIKAECVIQRGSIGNIEPHIVYAKNGTVTVAPIAITNMESYVELTPSWDVNVVSIDSMLQLGRMVELFSYSFAVVSNCATSITEVLKLI